MIPSFVREEYIAHPFCTHDNALNSLSRIENLVTGSQMAFPDAVSMKFQIRTRLESSGLRFEDAITVKYEPIL